MVTLALTAMGCASTATGDAAVTDAATDASTWPDCVVGGARDRLTNYCFLGVACPFRTLRGLYCLNDNSSCRCLQTASMPTGDAYTVSQGCFSPDRELLELMMEHCPLIDFDAGP